MAALRVEGVLELFEIYLLTGWLLCGSVGFGGGLAPSRESKKGGAMISPKGFFHESNHSSAIFDSFEDAEIFAESLIERRDVDHEWRGMISQRGDVWLVRL